MDSSIRSCSGRNCNRRRRERTRLQEPTKSARIPPPREGSRPGRSNWRCLHRVPQRFCLPTNAESDSEQWPSPPTVVAENPSHDGPSPDAMKPRLDAESSAAVTSAATDIGRLSLSSEASRETDPHIVRKPSRRPSHTSRQTNILFGVRTALLTMLLGQMAPISPVSSPTYQLSSNKTPASGPKNKNPTQHINLSYTKSTISARV